MQDLAQTVGTLNLLGDESRLRLCALLSQRELSVSELVRVTGISQSRVSTHLARLREGGFVRDRRAGQSAFYALSSTTLPNAARAILDEAASSPDATLEGDRRRLSELDAERLGTLPESFAGEMERHYSPGRTWQSLAAGMAALLDLGDVLDVGSGDGAAASFLAAGCRSLTCIDTSAAMIAAAKKRLAEHAHVRSLVADVHDLPFAEGSFDSVLLFHTLTYVERPKRAVAECARVLRPGGRLVVLSLDEHDQAKITSAYGERHPGLSSRALKALLSKAALEPSSCQIACRETKKPHFVVLSAVARKPQATPKKKSLTRS
jgi:SAM-dependent methyltransferase